MINELDECKYYSIGCIIQGYHVMVCTPTGKTMIEQVALYHHAQKQQPNRPPQIQDAVVVTSVVQYHRIFTTPLKAY